MKKVVLIIIAFLFNFYAFSQSSAKIIDSLKQVISLNTRDSLKVKVYGDLCWYYRNVSIDSAFKFGNLALKLSKKTNNQIGEAQAYNDIGILYYGLAEYTTSLNFYQKSLNIRSKLKDSFGIAALYNKIGLVHQNTFKMDSAIFYATKALNIYEAKQNIRYTAAIKNNIANIYKGLKQYKKALNAHIEIAEINENIKDYRALTRSYNNIANAYLFLKDTLNSIEYYKKGIDLAEVNDYKNELAALYNNYGGVLHNKKLYNKAVNLIFKSLKLREQLKDNYGIASASLHLAGVYLDFNELNKVEPYLRKGLKLSKQSDANELKMDAYDKLTTYYAIKKNVDSIIYYKELFKEVKDTIFSLQVIKEVADVQEKYNASEREKQILSQKAHLAEKELNLNRKNTQLIGLTLLIVVIAIFSYLLHSQQKAKNNQLKKESELKEALVKIETQNELQEQRLRISRDLHDNVGAQLTFIISTIENLQYGFKLTNKKLVDKLINITEFTKETISELRDTIWAMNKNEITFEDLQSRISNYIDKAHLSDEHIDFSFLMDEHVNLDKTFSSVQGMNVYRIIQESINNALKYAKASAINVTIENTKDHRLLVTIFDNGIGFNLENVELGNGINNMKKRAEDINAQLNIKGDNNQGTSITLIV
jgi:signal transduction histidine kinase